MIEIGTTSNPKLMEEEIRMWVTVYGISIRRSYKKTFRFSLAIRQIDVVSSLSVNYTIENCYNLTEGRVYIDSFIHITIISDLSDVQRERLRHRYHASFVNLEVDSFGH